MESELRFEAALDQLERTVEELEAGELGLDAALAKYEQGVRLLAHCHGLLEGAERKVALLAGVDGQGLPILAPFDATATAERDARPSSGRPADGSGDGADEDGEPF